MGFTRGHLISLLLYISVANEIQLPTVTCQGEEGSQCLPRKAFLALLRLPEVSSNLAAYSRTARIIQDAKGRDDIAHLKALSAEESDDAEICIPGGVYLELFRDPAMRGHLSAIGRTQKVLDYAAGRGVGDDSETGTGELVTPDAEKRGIATLAKNDDLPITIRAREQGQDDEEKRSAPRYDGATGDDLDSLIGALADDERLHDSPVLLRDYALSLGHADDLPADRAYPASKRNVGSLARDFALPTGRRNVASLARDRSLPSGKRNVGSLARGNSLPYVGKRNVASLARVYMLPQTGKRNVASLARDYGLPYGKRYLDAVARSAGLPVEDYEDGEVDDKDDDGYDGYAYEYADEGKRNVASLARNAQRPGFAKRSIILPSEDSEARNRSNRRIADERRPKRQIDFSDEYPLPAMQNALDYEDMIEALAGQYANPMKRFMGTGPAPEKMQAGVGPSGFPETFQPSKRHIGSLARLGWLPSFRPARFSRSPRYLVDRENPADGAAADYTADAPAWPLRSSVGSGPRYLQALHGDCRHGFKKFLLLPTVENLLPRKARAAPGTV